MAVALGACEESVDPFLETDRNFTLFGTLDMARDTQFVRVIPVRQTLLTHESALDVTFTSEDLVTGITTTWRDSVITFADGTVGHVFYAPLRVRTGHTYRIEVTSPDFNVTTSAETTVPPMVEAVVFPETVSAAGSGIGEGRQRILWRRLGRAPFRIEQWYRFIRDERVPFLDARVPYEPQNGFTDEGWEVVLNLRQDRLALDTLVTLDEYALVGLGMRVTVLDEAFVPPGGVFDAEVLVQPGALSNVENGFGFVGSVARFSTEWVLDDVSARRLRYLTLEDLFGNRAGEIREQSLRTSPLSSRVFAE